MGRRPAKENPGSDAAANRRSNAAAYRCICNDLRESRRLQESGPEALRGDSALAPPLFTLARINICFPSGFQGSDKYRRISAGETGSRDFTVSGRKRGRQSMTSYPCARRKSEMLLCE